MASVTAPTTMPASDVRKDVLPNGLTVISEEMPQVRSVTVGIWLKTGSRAEPAALNGISHFIEHMVFKGTKHRSAEQIAREADALGGNLDAFTGKELVCFNAKVLDDHLPQGFDILSDMLLNPLFLDPDIEKERNVVLEEIKMDEDNPETLVHELFVQNFWPEHPIGRPILGTPKTLAGFSHTALAGFFRECYVPNQMLVTAAGRVDHARLVDLVAQKFLHLPAHPNGFQEPAPAAHAPLTKRNKQDLEQVHLCIGMPCYPMTDKRRYVLSVLNTILGGGMSSRLFQQIREQQGLVYSIASDIHCYRDAGCQVVYAGTGQQTARRTLRLILRELTKLKQEPVTVAELERAQDNLKAGLMFSLESTAARMSRLGRLETYFGRQFSLDETLAQVDAVTPEQVQAAAREFFRPELLGASVLGHLDGLEISREELDC